MKKLWCLLVLLSLLACREGELAFNPPTNNSSGIIDVVRTYGGSRNDIAQSVVATSDGGFAVVGYSQSNDGDLVGKPNESYDFWLLKFNSEAVLEWTNTYGGTGDDRAFDLIQTSDGGFALLGYSNSADGDVTSNNGGRDFWLVKTDMQGNLQWQRSYGFAGNDEGNSLIETSDGSFLLSGVLDVTASGGQGNFGRTTQRHAGGDYWALKVSSSSGNLIWSRYYGGSFTDTPFGIVETSDNGFIFPGSSDSNDVDITNNKGSYDFWVVKSGTNGDLAWQQSYGGNEIDQGRGIATTSDGNYLLVGDTRSNDQDVSDNKGAADLWIVKISENGDLLWNRSIGGTGFDVPRSVYRTSDNAFVIAGSSRSSDGDVSENKGQNDAWIVKVNSEGQLIWETTVGGTDIDFAYDAVELLNGTIIAVGETNSADGNINQNRGFTDLLIIKLD